MGRRESSRSGRERRAEWQIGQGRKVGQQIRQGAESRVADQAGGGKQSGRLGREQKTVAEWVGNRDFMALGGEGWSNWWHTSQKDWPGHGLAPGWGEW